MAHKPTPKLVRALTGSHRFTHMRRHKAASRCSVAAPGARPTDSVCVVFALIPSGSGTAASGALVPRPIAADVVERCAQSTQRTRALHVQTNTCTHARTCASARTHTRTHAHRQASTRTHARTHTHTRRCERVPLRRALRQAHRRLGRARRPARRAAGATRLNFNAVATRCNQQCGTCIRCGRRRTTWRRRRRRRSSSCCGCARANPHSTALRVLIMATRVLIMAVRVLIMAIRVLIMATRVLSIVSRANSHRTGGVGPVT
jgi:hypothetical protein